MLIIGIVLMLSGSIDCVVGQRLNAPNSIKSQELLPSSTKAWFSIPDATKLDKKFLETQIGQLAKNKEIAPFVESIKGQFKNWMNDKNVRLGLKLEDVQGVRSGEICIAGILPNQAPANGQNVAADSHGLVLLVDVAGNLDAANGLMKKLAADLTARGATKEKFSDSIDAEVSKWKFPSKSRIKKPRHAYHTITGGWLLSSDNEAIFRRILRKLVNIDDSAKGQALADHPAFQGVMNKVKLEGVEPEVFWYVNPFGYIQLAQAIARERQKFNQKNSDDWAKILKKIGFDGFKGVGGYLALATGDHELLHRTFVFKPANPAQNIKQKQVFGIMDFRNAKNSMLTPPPFVSDDVSGYLAASWNMQRALKNVGHAIDTFAKKDGTFSDTLDSLREQMQVDVPKVVENFDNELMVLSDSKMPVQKDSERLVIAIRLKGNSEFVEGSIKRSYPHQHKLISYQGMEIIELDLAGGGDDSGLDWEDDPFRDPDEEEQEEEEVEEQAFNLFEKKYCVTFGDHLFIANNLEYLKGVLKKTHESSVSNSEDYQRVAESLELMSEGTNVSFRQFSRLDRVLRPNYEMMRSGKMAASDTILARLINQLFDSNKNDPLLKRKQKIDGSKLPTNYELHIAPFLGPSGWVMETLDDGWLFTGVVLERKKNSNQVVKKQDASSGRKSR